MKNLIVRYAVSENEVKDVNYYLGQYAYINGVSNYIR